MPTLFTHVPEAIFFFLWRKDTGVLLAMSNMHSYASASQRDDKRLQPEDSRAGGIAMASHPS